MQEIIDNDFIRIYTEAEKSLVRLVYKEGADYTSITYEVFEHCMNTYAKEVHKLQLTKILIDARYSELVITPDMQAHAAKIGSTLLANVKKIGFVLSKHLFSHVSRTQMMDEEGLKDAYDTQYFDTLEEAENWLGISSVKVSQH